MINQYNKLVEISGRAQAIRHFTNDAMTRHEANEVIKIVGNTIRRHGYDYEKFANDAKIEYFKEIRNRKTGTTQI